MKSILSTKKLKPHQRDLLLGSGFRLMEYDAITIDYLNTNVPTTIKNAIFTSQNAFNAIINKAISIRQCFCVGEKTKALLEKNGQKVIKTSKNASELGEFIQKNYQNEKFYFFSGTLRREEISASFENSKNTIFELKTYKTEINFKKFKQKWDGILFFSPSGVESFCNKNKIAEAVAICIGETTAKQARKYSENVVVANTTTIESVIAKAVHSLKNEHFLKSNPLRKQ